MRALEHARAIRFLTRGVDRNHARFFMWLACALALAALSGCGARPPKGPRERRAPAPSVSVTLERVTLRANVWMDAHAHLIAAASGREKAAPGVARAVAVYGRHEGDARASRSLFGALAACTSRACAQARFGTSPIGDAYTDALPAMESAWAGRYDAIAAAVRASRAGAEVARLDALVFAISRSLEITWPDAVFVDLTASSVDPAFEEVLPPVLSARGPCFVAMRKETLHTRAARTTECILAYAVRGLAKQSALYAAMVAHGGEARARRAWERIAPFAVASLVLSRSKPHVSVPLRAVESADRAAATWLRGAWADRLRGESAESFARHAVDALAPPP